MKSAVCPSCGAPVVFQSTASVLAVCAYCQSTLVRDADSLKNLGRMADLLEDNSPLQLGAEGRYRGVHFALIGRIQLKYEAGVWNEWHILFDDGRSGWLSDASGDMTVTFRVPPEKIRTAPPFEQLQPGQRITLDGQVFVVGNLEKAHVIAAAGELPQSVTPGYDAPVADLRTEEDAGKPELKAKKASGDVPAAPFATIDYSDDPPAVFIGEALPFADLKLSGLKEGAPVPGIGSGEPLKVRTLACPGCGGPLTAHTQEIVTIGCPGCGTIIDCRNEALKTISLSKQALKFKPDIPLGSKGRFDGIEYEAIGMLVQKTKVDGVTYFWREYLLHAPQAGFRWLSEYHGHWNFIAPVPRLPQRKPADKWKGMKLEGREYSLFQTTTATVEQVIGEFYWRVKQGDKSNVADYIAPPYVLSQETTGKEITWSRGQYIEGRDVWKTLGISGHPPYSVGVGANQPSPYLNNNITWLCLGLAALALLIQMGLALFNNGGQALLNHKMSFLQTGREEAVQAPASTFNRGKVTPALSYANPPDRAPDTSSAMPATAAYIASQSGDSKTFSTLRTPIFHFGGGHLLLRDKAWIDDNRWLGVDLTLVNQKTGQEIPAYREVYRASGRDSDGFWSEDKTIDDVIFRNIEDGDYYVLVDAVSNATSPNRLELQVRRADIGWGNWWLLNSYLLLLVLIAAWRKESFEVRRWSESDYPRTSWVNVLKENND